MFTHCVTRYECFKVGITLFSSSSLSSQILIQNYLLIYFQYIVVPNQREVVSNWLYSTSILWHNFVTLWKYSTLPPKRSSSELLTVRKFTSTERFALIFCFVIQNLWNGWETEDFSNSKGFQIWRYCILLGEVLAKDTTRWNVSVCSGLSLCRLNVWVWLGLLLWMEEWICVGVCFVCGTLSLIPKGVTKCNYFPMMTVLQPIWWAHNNTIKSKVPSLFTFAVCCEQTFMPLEKTKLIPFVTKQYQASLAKQYIQTVSFCHING